MIGYGVIRYLFIKPYTGINLLTLQPTIIDGTIAILLGSGFFIGGIYILSNREKLEKDLKDNIVKRKKEAVRSPKWLKHK